MDGPYRAGCRIGYQHGQAVRVQGGEGESSHLRDDRVGDWSLTGIRSGAPIEISALGNVNLIAVQLANADKGLRSDTDGPGPALAHIPGIRLIARGGVSDIAIRKAKAGDTPRHAVRQPRLP